MKAPKSGRNGQDAPGKGVRLSPKLSACANTILTRRYIEDKTFPDLLKFLAAEGIQTCESRLHEFIRRVLYVVGAEQAKQIGVNAELLMVVRRRLGLPLEPRGRKIVTAKPRKRFDPRNRRHRRITLPSKRARPAPSSAQSQQQAAPLKDPFALKGVVSQLEPSQAEITAFHALSRQQIAIVHAGAIKKIRSSKDGRNIITNQKGTCFHLVTRVDYSAEQLRELFDLTYAEAEVLFLTIDDPAT